MAWADQNCAKCTDDMSGLNCHDCILQAFKGDTQEFDTCCPCIWRAAKMFRLVCPPKPLRAPSCPAPQTLFLTMLCGVQVPLLCVYLLSHSPLLLCRPASVSLRNMQPHFDIDC